MSGAIVFNPFRVYFAQTDPEWVGYISPRHRLGYMRIFYPGIIPVVIATRFQPLMVMIAKITWAVYFSPSTATASL